MAPDDRDSSTALLDPIPRTASSIALLDLIPDRSTQILVPPTCTGIEAPQEGGLVICISDTNSNISTTLCQPSPSPCAEEGTTSAVSLVREPVQTPQAQLVKRNLSVTKKTIKNIGMSVTPTTYGENHGVLHDSACSQAVDDHNTAAAGPRACANPYNRSLSQCTDTNGRRTGRRQTVFRLTDFNQLHSSPDTCKYVNTVQHNVKQNFSERNGAAQDSWRRCTDSDVSCASEASHTPLGCHTPLRREGGPVGNLPNWLRAVKPEVKGPAVLCAEESWPPLLACSKKGETSGSDTKISYISRTQRLGLDNNSNPLFAAHRKHEDIVRVGNVENQSHSFTVSQHGTPAVPLDELSWPSLEKSCKPSVLHDDYCSNKRRTLRPLVKSNMYHHSETGHTMQDQRQHVQQFTSHGSFHETENMHIPPLLLMLNKDFIVTSPLKENLLLLLVLMGQRTDVETSDSFHGQTTEGETKRQILVGQFKAFSSFLHFMLGRDATRVRTESNAGGTSTISESLSVEYFVRRFQAKDVVTEMEVEYQSFNWKKVDYICTLYGQRVGVSVTRAMSFPDPKDFSAQMAYRLLYKKLFGLVVARHGVSKRHSFSQCILHVWCETQQTATIMQKEYDGVSQELDIADDVVMVLTIADGRHARPIFYESLLKNA